MLLILGGVLTAKLMNHILNQIHLKLAESILVVVILDFI